VEVVEALVVGAIVAETLVGGTDVVDVPGVARAGVGVCPVTVGTTVATPSPRMAKAWAPSAESEDLNMTHAAVSDNFARDASGGGVTSRSP
jgi:hypothetical protein